MDMESKCSVARLLPIGFFFYTEAGDAVREAINQWIRTSRSFDGIVDFDKALRDPLQQDRLLPGYQSGDWLHPNNAGYAVMADAINPALFSTPGLGRSGSQQSSSPLKKSPNIRATR